MGKAKRKQREFKTEITEDELVELINKYTNYHYRVWKSYHRLHADWDDLYLEVAEAACEGRKNYMAAEVKAASITTYIIRCIGKRISKYRRSQYVRQVKHPFARIKGYCTPADGYESDQEYRQRVDVIFHKKLGW